DGTAQEELKGLMAFMNQFGAHSDAVEELAEIVKDAPKNNSHIPLIGKIVDLLGSGQLGTVHVKIKGVMNTQRAIKLLSRESATHRATYLTEWSMRHEGKEPDGNALRRADRFAQQVMIAVRHFQDNAVPPAQGPSETAEAFASRRANWEKTSLFNDPEKYA